jgi:flagellar biosynthetic protein FliP
MRTSYKNFSRVLVALALGVFLLPSFSWAAGGGVNIPQINIGMGGNKPGDAVSALRIIILLTVLSLAPAILIMMTSFTRIVVVLSFLRQALATQNMPPNQLIIGLSLFLSFFKIFVQPLFQF